MKTYALIVFSLFIQLISVFAQETYLQIAKQADDFSKNGKYQEAYEAYTKAIGMKSDEFGLWMNRAACLVNLKHYDDAVTDYNQALKLKANDAGALQGRASSKSMLKDYKGAIADLTTLLTLKPTDHSILLERGKVRLYDNDVAGSLVDFKECLKRSYKLAESNYWVGVAYFAQKKYKLATEAFEKANSMDKTLLDAYYRSALAYAEMGIFTKAVEKLNPMIQKNPSTTELYILRATLNIKAGKQEQAKTDLVKINELKPGSVDIVMLRIMLKNRLSDYKGAMVEIDSMLKVYPTGNELLYLERGKALHALTKVEEAESMFEQAMGLNPENVEVYHQLCLLNIERDAFRQAISIANKAIELNDQQANGWYLKGRALMGLEQGEEAFVAINQGLELDSEHPEVGHYYLGMAFEKMGKKQQAIDTYSQAIKLNDAYADAYYTRGLLQKKMNDLKAAAADFRRASALGNELASKELKAIGEK
jgi:tetratricopeptide (TPR) repeat protein